MLPWKSCKRSRSVWGGVSSGFRPSTVISIMIFRYRLRQRSSRRELFTTITPTASLARLGLWTPKMPSNQEAPGISVFYKDESGTLHHTYSCYARGLDMMNTAYHYLDLVPKGRDEGGLDFTMAWVRYHDKYEK